MLRVYLTRQGNTYG